MAIYPVKIFQKGYETGNRLKKNNLEIEQIQKSTEIHYSKTTIRAAPPMANSVNCAHAVFPQFGGYSAVLFRTAS